MYPAHTVVQNNEQYSNLPWIVKVPGRRLADATGALNSNVMALHDYHQGTAITS